MENILVTGACGEIGSALIAALSQENNNIFAIDVRAPKQKFENANFSKVDILNYPKVNKIIVQKKITTIFHLAAILSTSAEKDPLAAHQVNVEGTINLLKATLNFSKNNKLPIKFIFPSSIGVYGLPNAKVKSTVKKIKEDQYTTPRTMYGINKIYGELLGNYYSNYYQQAKTNIDFRCIRFPGIISAHTLPTGGTSDFAPEMIHAAIKGKDYECFVRSDTQIPFMTMPDAISAIVKIANTKRKLSQSVYNVGAFSMSAKEIENMLVKKFPKFRVTYKVDTARQHIVDSWPLDVNDKKARSDWGWKPKHSKQIAMNKYLIPEITEHFKKVPSTK